MSNYKRYVSTVLSLLSFVGTVSYASNDNIIRSDKPTKNVYKLKHNLIMTDKTTMADNAVNGITSKFLSLFKNDVDSITIRRALEIWKSDVMQSFLRDLPISKLTPSGSVKSDDEKNDELLSKLDDIWSVCIVESSKSLADKQLSHYVERNKETGSFKLLPRSTPDIENLEPVYEKIKSSKSLDQLASLVINKCSKAWVISEAPLPTKNDLIRADGNQIVKDENGGEKIVPVQNKKVDYYSLRPNQNPVSGEITPSQPSSTPSPLSTRPQGKRTSSDLSIPALAAITAAATGAAFGVGKKLQPYYYKPKNSIKTANIIRR